MPGVNVGKGAEGICHGYILERLQSGLSCRLRAVRRSIFAASRQQNTCSPAALPPRLCLIRLHDLGGGAVMDNQPLREPAGAGAGLADLVEEMGDEENVRVDVNAYFRQGQRGAGGEKPRALRGAGHSS